MKDEIAKKVESKLIEYSNTYYGLSDMSSISYAIGVLIKQAVPEADSLRTTSGMFEDAFEAVCRFKVGNDLYTAVMSADANVYYCNKVVPQ